MSLFFTYMVLDLPIPTRYGNLTSSSAYHQDHSLVSFHVPVSPHLYDIRSTTGYVFTLVGGHVCWKSIIQSLVAMSTTKTKYIVVAEASKEAVWLARLVKELGIEQGGVQLHCDSQSVINLAKNQVYHAKTKHIDVRFHKIRELMTSSQILLRQVHTPKNATDMLTKVVTTDKFKHCLDLLNVVEC